jgi:hypothetical protein
MIRNTLLIATFILLATTSSSRAGILVSIGDLALAPGGVGTVDVTVSSSSGQPVQLDSFGFELQIATVSGQGRLEFTPTQTDPFSSPNYVFYQNSGDNTPPGATTLGTVSSTLAPNDTYIGSDFTNDGSNTTFTGPMLLAHLTFTAATTLPPVLGSTFQVSLIPDFNTFFQYDSSTNPMTDSFTVSGGSISISSVPEPSSLLLAVIGVIPVLIAVTRKNHRRRGSLQQHRCVIEGARPFCSHQWLTNEGI